MSENKISTAQAISWVISAAVFFAGVTFMIIGRADQKTLEATAEQVRLNSVRLNKLETIVEVQNTQYLNILTAIAELKLAMKEHIK